jgi:hypothetical protein
MAAMQRTIIALVLASLACTASRKASGPRAPVDPLRTCGPATVFQLR